MQPENIIDELDLTEEQALEIEELLDIHKTPERIADMLHLELETINEYIKRKN